MLLYDDMKVLIIEDDDAVRNALVQALAEVGCKVEASANGAEGLYLALNWNFDAVVLDVMLPEKDGWQVLAELRKEKATPVLMLTARGEVEDRIRGLNGGADDYLLKPFVIDELIARVRALVRRSTGIASNEIDLGRVTIDTAGCQVYKDGESVRLSPAQYNILECLARRAGSLVSRTSLCESLSIEDEEEFSNVLDVHIYNIRKKLGKEFLQNRRGQGYIIPNKRG
jgi:two-component system OmpR family response regulator